MIAGNSGSMSGRIVVASLLLALCARNLGAPEWKRIVPEVEGVISLAAGAKGVVYESAWQLRFFRGSELQLRHESCLCITALAAEELV